MLKTARTWALSPGYAQGIFWVLMAGLSSVINDVFTKYFGGSFNGFQIAFMRAFFSTITLLPFMLYAGRNSFYTSRINVHFIRAALLFAAITPWSFALADLPLTVATTISFTVPLFVLPLAAVFLKERVGWQRTVATLVGFAGIIITVQPASAGLNTATLLLLASAVLFASLDVINKKFVVKESRFAMMFYSSLIMTAIAFIPCVLVWQMPTAKEWFFFVLLGGGANLILLCLLQAFSCTDVSALAPIRYTELLFSALIGLIVFAEMPLYTTLLGAGLIIPSALFIARYEMRKERLKKRQIQEQ